MWLWWQWRVSALASAVGKRGTSRLSARRNLFAPVAKTVRAADTVVSVNTDSEDDAF